MKKRKIAICLILCFCLVIGVGPGMALSAFAEEKAPEQETIATVEEIPDFPAEESKEEDTPEIEEDDDLLDDNQEESPEVNEVLSEETADIPAENQEIEIAENDVKETEEEIDLSVDEKSSFSIILNEVPQQLTVGETYQLSVHTEPEDLALVWGSSDSDILFVNETGTVTAKAVGEAKITVAAKDVPEVFAEAVLQIVAEEKPALDFAEVLQAQAASHKVIVTEDVVVTDSVQVPADVELYVEDGSLTVLGAGKLSIAGYCEVTGGEIVASGGAELINQGFVVVKNAGKLIVEDGGVYTHEDGAVVILDQSEGQNASVQGIDRGFVELTVAARTAEQLSSAIYQNGYAFVTVMVSSADLLSAAGIESLPDAVCISLMNG